MKKSANSLETGLPMNQEAPNLDEWRALFSAAQRYEALGCWEWMLDSDLIGVQNPETDEIGYCCVLGNLGEFIALAVYLGSDGLDGHERIESGEFAVGDLNALFVQRCLMASFEDREDLDKQDLKLIKTLGLKFRGRQAWPQFRSHLPGYAPWYLTAGEARFLTLALEQTALIAPRLKDNPDLLNPPEKGHYLVRIPEKKNDHYEWREEWRKPDPANVVDLPAPAVDLSVMQAIQKQNLPRHGIWEFDFFMAPFTIGENGRPYYPYIGLWVDHASGLVLHFDLTNPKDYRQSLCAQFLSLISNAGYLPQQVLVKHTEPYELAWPIADHLKFELRQVKALPLIEQAWQSLLAYQGR